MKAEDRVPLLESQRRLTSKGHKWTSALLPFLFPALGGLLYGYDIGATSSARLSIESPTLSGIDWYKLTLVEIGLVESGSLYGAFVGSLLAFSVADFLGRRRELLAASLFYMLGSLLTSLAPKLAVLLVGRLVYGFGIGLTMHAAPMYIAETCPTAIRGTLISMKEALIVFGMLVGYLVGYLAVEAVGGWRIMFGFASPISLIMMLGVLWLPSSPRWLILRAFKGKASLESSQEDAVRALRNLMGKDVDDEVIQDQLCEIMQSLEVMSSKVRLREIFRGTSLKALTIGISLVLFQQFTGQPSVLYYAAKILQSAGFPAASDATKVSIILGIFKIFMTLIAVWKVDRLGRRPLLIGGVSILTISIFVLALYYAFLPGASALAVVSLLLYVGAYQVSFGPIGWILLSEIFPLRTRGWALSITVLLNFAANAVMTFSFSPLQEALGIAPTFAIFGVVGVFAIIFIILKVPETKGLSLEEVEAKLAMGLVPL